MIARQGRRIGRRHRVSTVAVAAGLALALAVLAKPARAGDRPAPKSPPAAPSVNDNFLDPLLEEAWKDAGVKTARPASDEEFLRRAYLDLLGRIPSVEEARAFLGTREAGKRAKLIEYLLNHVDYPKHFATEWTTLLIGRTNQGRTGRPRGPDRLASQAVRRRPPLERDRLRLGDGRRLESRERGGQLHARPPRIRGRAAYRPDDPAVPGAADPVHPVPRPPHERLEAERFLGDQRVLPRGSGPSEKNVRPTPTGLGPIRPHRTARRADQRDVRFEKRNGMVGIAFPTFLDGKRSARRRRT